MAYTKSRKMPYEVPAILPYSKVCICTGIMMYLKTIDITKGMLFSRMVRIL